MTARDQLASLHLAHARWRKSSHSDNTGGNCVELAALSGAVWRKSSRSNNTGGNCVELAGMSDVRAVRDSKNAAGPALIFDAGPFGGFLAEVKAGVVT